MRTPSSESITVAATPTPTGRGLGQGDAPRKPGVAQACSACHQKKIRCDLASVSSSASGKASCTNCMLYSSECLPRLRKRTTKRPASPLSTEEQPVAQKQRVSNIIGSGGHRHGPNEQNNVQPSPAATQASDTTPTSQIHDGRSVYFDSMEGRLIESTKAYPQTSVLLPTELKALEHQRVFDLPSRAVKACYIDNFFRYCYPWAPIIEPAWFHETASEKPSLLLLRVVLVAGSRVTMPNDLEASAELYARARALFFSNFEPNPVIRVIACLLLRWWNPTGPERVCMDSSDFWIRAGVGIAVEIGLHQERAGSRDASFRRRLWWTVLAHDSQISGAHGRPRAIQTEEYHVSTLAVRDFSSDTQDRALSSVAYMNISRIFGEIGDTCRRNQMSARTRSGLINDLYTWVRELPSALRLFHENIELGPSKYNFEARQVHVIYFVAILLLFRPSTPSSPVPFGSFLAASFAAAIYEEFLIRGEIDYLGPAVHKFYLLATGITLLLARTHASLRDDANEDFSIVVRALKKFSERYPSALGTLHCLETLESSGPHTTASNRSTSPIHPEVRALFRELGPGFCRQWYLMDGIPSDRSSRAESSGHKSDEPQQRQGTGPPDMSGLGDASSDLHGDVMGTAATETQVFDPFWPLTCPDLPDTTSWILKDTPFDYGADLNVL